MNTAVDAAADGRQSKAKIFISYSRRDMAIVDRLEPALQAGGFSLLIDRAEIYAFENWWTRIETLITQADTIVFVLSPDSVLSEVCRKGVAFAASLNKRFAPIVCRRTDDKSVPAELARLNFIFFDDETQFENSVTRLTEALQTDIEWIRKHTEFGESARRWAAASRSQARGMVLRLHLLEDAERWIASRPPGAPLPAEATQAFIAESRRAASRRRNALSGGLAAGLVLALGLAGLAYWQRGVAVEAQELAVRNFEAAKSTVDGVLFDLTAGLRDVEGIRAETVRVILGRIESTIGDLASRTGNDPEVRRSQAVMYTQFSDISLRLGGTEPAVEYARKAIVITRQLIAEAPGNADWQHDLSVALERLGDALITRGDRPGALAAFREILDIRRTLVANDPRNASRRRTLVVILRKMGETDLAVDDLTAALKAYRESLDIMRALATSEPGNDNWQSDVEESLNMVGDVLMEQDDVANALALYREALGIARAVASRAPSDTGLQREVGICLQNVGNALRVRGDRAGALVLFREALDMDRARAAKDPGNTEWQRDLSVSLNKVADLLAAGDDRAGALALYREGLPIRRALAAKDQENAQWKNDILVSLERIAGILESQGEIAEAVDNYRGALDLARAWVEREPKRLTARLELIFLLMTMGPLVDPAEGRPILTEALANLEQLEQERGLPAEQKDWPEFVRSALSKLPKT